MLLQFYFTKDITEIQRKDKYKPFNTVRMKTIHPISNILKINSILMIESHTE